SARNGAAKSRGSRPVMGRAGIHELPWPNQLCVPLRRDPLVPREDRSYQGVEEGKYTRELQIVVMPAKSRVRAGGGGPCVPNRGQQGSASAAPTGTPFRTGRPRRAAVPDSR